jgi:site-specific DNA-methyltransferase (adenine-specific)
MSKSEVYNMDCMEYMSMCDDMQFDLAIVDPPYGIKEDGHCRTRLKHNNNVKHTKKYWDNSRPQQEYWKELFRVSKNQIVFGANYFTEYLPPSMGWIYWDKKIGGDFSDGELAFTSFDRALKSFTFWNGNNGIARIHPTQKPVQLYKWLLKNYAKEGDKILDTHLGSGSSRIACYDGGFDFYGTELDKEYFDASVKRFEIYKSQGKLF